MKEEREKEGRRGEEGEETKREGVVMCTVKGKSASSSILFFYVKLPIQFGEGGKRGREREGEGEENHKLQLVNEEKRRGE